LGLGPSSSVPSPAVPLLREAPALRGCGGGGGVDIFLLSSISLLMNSASIPNPLGAVVRRGGGAKPVWSIVVDRGFCAGIVFRIGVVDTVDEVGEEVKDGEAVR